MAPLIKIYHFSQCFSNGSIRGEPRLAMDRTLVVIAQLTMRAADLLKIASPALEEFQAHLAIKLAAGSRNLGLKLLNSVCTVARLFSAPTQRITINVRRTA